MNVRCSAAPARARAFALCCLIAASGPYGAAAQSPPAGRDSVDAFITGYMEEHRVPGIAAAIVDDGRLVKARGYGLANVEHSVPVTAETIFQSGSLGKQFTAAAVLLLAEDGRLSLDDPITDHLREAPASWDAVTIRHLLTHTAGLPDYEDWLDFRRDYEEEELVRGIGERPRVFEPGTAWSYSNSGYLVLGALVSRLSGAHWSEVLQERVFAPAGMETARLISEAEIVPHRSSGYRMEGGRLLNQEWVSPTLLSTGDGALYFTILDLVKWDQALRSGAILSAASRRAMWQPTRLTDGAEVRTGSAAPGPPAAAPMNRADAPKRPIFATNPRRPRPSNPNASPADGGEGGGG